MSPDFLIAGAFIGSILTFVAIAIPRYTRHILAATLIGAALVYIHFAVIAHASAPWLAAELTGVAIYGALAIRGVRRSAWWLVAGGALHPVWDVALHFAGPGHAFAPNWYTVSCLGWDVATAAIIAIAILIGTHLSAESLTPMSFRAERVRSTRAVEESGSSRQRGLSTGTRAIPRLRAFGPSLGMTGGAALAENDGGCAALARNDISCNHPCCTATGARAA
jgi:hypothetical protein